MWDKIVCIEELDISDAIDIEVSGNHLFYANDILTHNSNSDVDITDTSESFALPATVDFMLALVTSEELESLGQIMAKQLKNRYTDLGKCKRFVIGVDKIKMKLYDVEESAQDLMDDTPVMDKGDFGDREKAVNKKKNKFSLNQFEDFK